MNDIDCNVEVFNFTLHRRFSWKEIKSNKVMKQVLEDKLKGINFKKDENYNIRYFY